MGDKLRDGVIWCLFMGVLLGIAYAKPQDISQRNPNTMICDPETALNSTGCEVREADVPVHRRSKRDIEPGAGYSEDMQQVRSQLCFNVIGSSLSEPKSTIELSTARSASQLASELGISASISGSYGLFSADATASYFKSHDQDNQAISLNYYHYATSQITVQIGGVGEEALSEYGKKLYNDNKPYFGGQCGDHYISAYQNGALLTMGLNVILSSSADKAEFNGKFKASYGSFASASAELKSMAAKSDISASVTIQALQIGGDPSQLAQIFGEDDTRNYNAMTCNIKKMDDCVRASSALLSYAKNNFPTQFSFKDNIGLVPLGLGFATYTPIKWLGLTAPPSLVTQEVFKYRDQLASKLKENEYYRERISHFLNGDYPLKLDASFINQAQWIFSTADSNVQILRRSHGGGVDCFNKPDDCKSIKAKIDAELVQIRGRDLAFLEDIKYTILIDAGMLYNTGGGSGQSWELKLNDPAEQITVLQANINQAQCQYILYVPSDAPPQKITFTGYINRMATAYAGRWCLYPKCRQTPTDMVNHWCPGAPDCKDDVFPERKLSPFYFEPYQHRRIWH